MVAHICVVTDTLRLYRAAMKETGNADRQEIVLSRLRSGL
jgi:hypothetical protein